MLSARAITSKDIKEKSSGRISSEMSDMFISSVKAGTVMCDRIFGSSNSSYDSDSKMQNESLYTNVGHIELPISYLNPFMARCDGGILKKILLSPKMILSKQYDEKYAYDNKEIEEDEEESEYDFDSQDNYDEESDDSLDITKDTITKNWVTDLMYGATVLCKSSNEIVHVSDINISKPNDYLIGGDALSYLIKIFLKDIDTEILREVMRVVLLPVIDNGLRGRSLKDLRIEGSPIERLTKEDLKKKEESGIKTDGYMWLWDNIYLTMPDRVKPTTKNDILRQVNKLSKKKGYLTSANSRLYLLLAVRNNPDSLINMISKYVVVIPRGYRDMMDGRMDALTVYYNKLVILVNKLSIAMKTNDIRSRIITYAEVMAYISYIMIGKHLHPRKNIIQKNAAFKSLIQILSGKKGVIRGKMQSVRIDYSGRSVISFEPDMPLDTIGVPYEMLVDLMQYHLMKYYKDESDINIVSDKINKGNYLNHIHAIDYLAKNLCILFGRQPTLHRLGIQAFNIKPIYGKAIKLSPLVVMPFNADFDGDQGHVEMPITVCAQAEAKEVMSIIKNLAYPKNGEITVTPRHEILYGLWASLEYIDIKSGKSISKDMIKDDDINRTIFNMIMNNEISIYDVIDFKTDYGSAGIKAGKWAIYYIFKGAAKNYTIGEVPLALSNGKEKVKEKWCKVLLSKIAADDQINGTSKIIQVVTDMTMYGFAIAEIFPPKLSTSYNPDIEELLNDFNEKVSNRDKLVKRGIELESAYTDYFKEEFDILKGKVEKIMLNELGDSGFISMMESGAKGSKSNLMQIFGMRGQIMKDASTAFNSIIKSSLYSQLTPLEHFISAYGSRQGIADKTLETAGQGYLTRQLEYSGQGTIICCEDCEDDEGLKWEYKDIYHLVDASILKPIERAKQEGTPADYSHATDKVIGIMASYILGRNVIHEDDSSNSMSQEFVKTKERANEIASKAFAGPNSKGLRVRSPITCKMHCCQKCYGTDLTNLKHFNMDESYPPIGTSIQNIAAEAIGEPGTQLTMKNFQKGGVASAANLTSSADKVNHYFKLASARDGDILTNEITYDPIATCSGYIKEINRGNGTKTAFLTDDKGKKIAYTDRVFNVGIDLKSYVQEGESYQLVQGDLNMNELLQVNDDSKFRKDSTFRALKYLLTMEHSIFNQETNLNMKHFEVIVSGLLRFTITKDNASAIKYGFKAGDCLGIKDAMDLLYWADKDEESIEGFWSLYGINEVQKYKNDFLSTFFMERISENAPINLLTNPTDSLSNPITQLSLGIRSHVGTYYRDYTKSTVLKNAAEE